MKLLCVGLLVLISLSGCQSEEDKKKIFLNETMVPMVREFIQRNQLQADPNFPTNFIAKSKVEFFYKPFRGIGSIYLQNHYLFNFYIKGQKTELSFRDGKVKTYYDLIGAPQEKIDAVKALNRKNKLSEKSAIELATKYFLLQGHKLEDFHPPECLQRYWSGTNLSEDHNLPYYGVEWFRKDVNLKDVDEGYLRPSVLIEVSGITTNLISYAKYGMPVGSDF